MTRSIGLCSCVGWVVFHGLGGSGVPWCVGTGRVDGRNELYVLENFDPHHI